MTDPNQPYFGPPASPTDPTDPNAPTWTEDAEQLARDAGLGMFGTTDPDAQREDQILGALEGVTQRVRRLERAVSAIQIVFFLTGLVLFVISLVRGCHG